MILRTGVFIGSVEHIKFILAQGYISIRLANVKKCLIFSVCRGNRNETLA